MSISEAFASSQAVDTTEWSMTTDTSGPDVDTSDGVFQLWLDLSDMVTGDQLQITIYEKVFGSTQYKLYQAYAYGPQPYPNWVSPTFVLTEGWDMTLKAIAGTITVDWSIRSVV